MSKQFTEKEKKLLSQYISNVDGDIFAIQGLQGIAGPVFARYSRARGSLKETLLKEFLNEGVVNQKNAQSLIERILIAYGDDSVGELEGAHLSLENISNLATKEIEDRRIGGSPIEQSTRYVVYDQKDEKGRWRYLRVPEIMNSKYASEFEAGMNKIFEIYINLIKLVEEFYKKKKGELEAEYDLKGSGEMHKLKDLKEEKDIKAFKLTYKFDVRTKTCDTVRVLLPVCTQTNAGLFGNGRYFQHLLSHLYSSNLKEMQDIARRAHQELNKVIPVFVKRAKRNEYIVEIHNNMQKLADKIFKGISPIKSEEVVLYSPVAIDLEQYKSFRNQDIFTIYLIAFMLYKYVEYPLSQIIKIVNNLNNKERQEIIQTYLGQRQSRRDRPGRALEYGYPFTFDITADYGIYRDLERHRMLTQIRQKLTPYLDFALPSDLEEAGVVNQVKQCQEISEDLYEKIKLECGRDTAQYAVLFGYNLRFSLGMNLREAMHILELRTVKQGHSSYRRICQIMHNKIKERSVWVGEALKFVDHNNYTWAREDSEAKQRVKERQWEEKNMIRRM